MSVKTYSLKNDGNISLSGHFKVREFRCKDGSDTILISPNLIVLLEQLRLHFNKPITVVSGYRTPSYNQLIGGAANSQHIYGTAADIVIAGVSPLAICRKAEGLLGKTGGIGHYVDRFTHVDVRTTRARWVQERSGQSNVSSPGFYPTTIRLNGRGHDVILLQDRLIALGYDLSPYGADGHFGKQTRAAVIAFQRLYSLTADGVVGPKTLASLGV